MAEQHVQRVPDARSSSLSANVNQFIEWPSTTSEQQALLSPVAYKENIFYSIKHFYCPLNLPMGSH